MKPVSLEIVVVTDNPQAVGQLSPNGTDVRTFPANFGMFSTKELQLFQKASDAAKQFKAMPVDLLWADKNKASNIVYINQNSITNFPSIQISATYPDGSIKWFRLNTTITDLRNYSVSDMVGMMRSLEKGKDADDGSLLCKLFPPLCSVGAYVWLGVVGFAAYQAFTADNKNKRLVFGAAALVAGNEFISRGGLKTLRIS